MAKLSFPELKTAVASYITANGVSYGTFSATQNNSAMLVDKIGEVITLDTSFVDKLDIFDGSDLVFGKIIEEWHEDLILPQDYSS